MRTLQTMVAIVSVTVLTSCAKPSPRQITPAEARKEILEVYQSHDQGFETQNLDGVFHHDDKALITDDAAKAVYSTFVHGSDFKSVTQIVQANFTATGATVTSITSQNYKLMNCTWNSEQGIKEPFIDNYRCLDTWALRPDGWWLMTSHTIMETHTRNGQPFDPSQ